jgi:aryl-alcohol dehydrogenase-like predicted oxidoreductase
MLVRLAGQPARCSQPATRQAPRRRAVELGIAFIDTASLYGPHVSEEIIRAALYAYPEHVPITTHGSQVQLGPGSYATLGRPEFAAAREITDIASVQNQYTVIEHGHEDVLEYCTHEGLPFISWFRSTSARWPSRTARLPPGGSVPRRPRSRSPGCWPGPRTWRRSPASPRSPTSRRTSRPRPCGPSPEQVAG